MFEENQEVTISDIVNLNVDQVKRRARLLAPKDPTNPWYPLLEGVADYLNESDEAAGNLKKAVFMPMENPYHYLKMGNILETLNLYDLADSAYEEAYKRFLAWYRPYEIYSRFTGHKYFIKPAREALIAGKEERVEKLLDWLRKFQPLGEKMDRVELESAAWWHRKGDATREARAMERYGRAAREAHGLTLRRYFISDQIVNLTCVLLTISVAFLLIMAARYRKVRKATLSELGLKNFESRTIAAIESPAFWFKFNTLSFMKRGEKRVLLSLWIVLLVFISALSITCSLLKIQDNTFLIQDIDSTWFENKLRYRLGVERMPEIYFLLGLAFQQKGNARIASAWYGSSIFAHASGDVAARTFNNRGVIEFEKENLEKAKELFNKASRMDPWLAEPLYNRGIIENKQSFKQRAIQLGLEPEYMEFHPGRAVRCGPDANTLAASFTGFRYNLLPELARRWAQILTGYVAWKYTKGYVVPLYYIYLIFGLVLMAYQLAPRHDSRIDDENKVGWWCHLVPGLSWMLRGKPLLGSVTAAVFLYSLLCIYLHLRFGLPGIITAAMKPSPTVYLDLSTTDLLRQEPTIKGVTIFAWVALALTVFINSMVLWKTNKNRKS